jgi:hypothetical protein
VEIAKVTRKRSIPTNQFLELPCGIIDPPLSMISFGGCKACKTSDENSSFTASADYAGGINFD